VVVARVVKGIGMEVERVGWVWELNRTREVLKTENHGFLMIFRH